MAVYTVHQPPLGKGENAPDPARFVFVRDGFYVWGFLLSALWMLWNRLLLAAVLFVALSVLIAAGLKVAGLGSNYQMLAAIALSFLVGLEGSTLRRWTLSRRGFTNVGVVVADDVDEAERRFFANWADRKPAATPPAAPAAEAAPRMMRSAPSDVIGSFPQPERPR